MPAIKQKKIYFLACFTVALILMRPTMSDKKDLSVYYSFSASSVDPIDYDLGVHHVTMRSIYSSLVSEYNVGKIAPDIALDWKNSEDFKKWSFLIDKSRRFQSGEFITPEQVAFSLNRMAFLMKSRDSKAGLMDNLVGFEKVSSASDLVDGITYDDNYVYLNFKVPMPRLLNKIGFGLYGIVHRADFDAKTGIWKDKRVINSSGHYKITSWLENELIIAIKDEFKNKNRFEKIHFYFVNYDNKINYDLVAASSEADLSHKKYNYSANVISRIRYIEFTSWNDSKSVFYKKSNRIAFMQDYYNKVESNKLNIVRSFFPLSISGVNELLPHQIVSDEDITFESAYRTNGSISFVSRNYTTEKASIIKPSNHTNLLHGTIYEFANKHGLKVNDFKSDDFTQQEPLKVDVKIDTTGILLDDPEGDIKFMFLSKEGIQLPDQDGSIIEMLNADSFQIQEVNKKLWDQGIVWPVNHLSFGIWFNSDLKYNSKELNLELFPIDFWWLKVD